MSKRKLVVAGGGAAGFFCAINAARLQPGLEVTIAEKTGKLLSKVKVSGGGRCNVTHDCNDISDMSRMYPRGTNFVRKTFHQFFTTDTIEWFKERGVQLRAEMDGRMFPVTDSSQTIIDCLLREASRYQVNILMNTAIIKTGYLDNGRFHLQLNNERELTADYLCIATGGYPRHAQFDWIAALGHSVEEPVPSLFTFNLPGNNITALMGISVEKAKVKIPGTKLEEEGPLLITHWGMSGPAVLKLSAWGARVLKGKGWHFPLQVNWTPDYHEQQLVALFQQWRYDIAAQKTGNKNSLGLPNRLWEYLLHYSDINPGKRWADLSAKEQNRLAKNLSQYPAEVKGKTTFKEEFVTAGGIRLSEVDPQTMMSKKVSRLFFAGEVLDVDGVTGGFNFQHAWTTGFIAAKNIAELAANE